MMNSVSEYVEDKVYRYKHEIVFCSVIKEFKIIIDCWCKEQLSFRYCKARHIPMFNRCISEFKSLNDYEEHLFVNLVCNDVLNIIKEK